MEWNGDKQWWLGEHFVELMVPLDFINTRPCFPQQDIFFWGYAEWSLVFKYFGTFGKIVGSASLVICHFPRSSRTVNYILKILFYLLTYLKIKHRHRFSTFQTCTNLFQSVQPTAWMLLLCLAARIISGIYPLLLDQDSLERSHRLLQNPNQSTSTQDSLEGSHRLLQNPNQSTSTQDSLEGSHRLLQNPNQSTSTQIYLEHHGIIVLGTGVTVPISLTFYRKFAL